MPAIAPIPPKKLKRLFEALGYSVRHEDDYNWALFKSSQHPIVVIPKLGKLVSVRIMNRLLDEAMIDNKTYFDTLAKIESKK